jgi:hypothetical protein
VPSTARWALFYRPFEERNCGFGSLRLMDRATTLPNADFSIFLFLLSANGVMAAFAFCLYVLMSPTVLKNEPASTYKRPPSAIVQSPKDHKARLERENASIAKAKEINAEANATLTRAANSSPIMPAETRPKLRQVARMRTTTKIARIPKETGWSAWGYYAQANRAFPQRSYALSQW